MDEAKRKRLEKAGWKATTVKELLDLSDSDVAYIEMKLALSKSLVTARQKRKLTQMELAKRLHTSQSRVAKMEGGDPSVSLDLLIRALLALGARPSPRGRIFGFH